MTRVRKFERDGKLVTTTTTKVVATGEENKVKEEHNLRSVNFLSSCLPSFQKPKTLLFYITSGFFLSHKHNSNTLLSFTVF